MTSPVIGSAVKRKEDYRFITGQGRYTDDINRPGQAHAYFLRSPYAHARIKRIDATAARATKGVVAIITGADFAESKLAGLSCGWMITSKDGSPKNLSPPAASSSRMERSSQRQPPAADGRPRPQIPG